MNYFKKKKSPNKPIDIYDSIETLPIWNWNRISETKDFAWLKKNDDYVPASILKKTWEKIFAEFIDRFGWSENFFAQHNKEKEIAFLQHQFIVTGDRSICTFVEIAKKELALINGGGEEDSNFWKSVAFLKQNGFSFDVKIISVVEFHSYFELIREQRKSA